MLFFLLTNVKPSEMHDNSMMTLFEVGEETGMEWHLIRRNVVFLGGIYLEYGEYRR